MINASIPADFFDHGRFAGDDQSHETPGPIGRAQQGAIEGADPPRFSMIGIRDVQRLDWDDAKNGMKRDTKQTKKNETNENPRKFRLFRSFSFVSCLSSLLTFCTQ